MKIQIVKFDDARQTAVILPADAGEFERVEPLPYHKEAGRRAVEISGRHFLLAPDCPDDGLAVWSAEPTADEAAKDAAILVARAALAPAQLAAVGLADAKTRSERVAQKIADDAEAEVRRVAAEAAKAAPE